MNRLLLLFLGFTILLSSCTKEDPVPTDAILKVRFLLTYDGQPLVFNQNQAFSHGDFIRMTKFNFFLTGLKIRTNGDSVKLAELSLVDFTQSNTSLAGASGGLILTVPAVKVGNYTSIEFGIGLPPGINATKPANYTSGNPLSDAGAYWPGWNGYIFSKMEGKYDSLSTGGFGPGFTFHTGLDKNYRIVKLNKSLIIDGNAANNEVAISLDLKKLFVMNGQPIDLFEVHEAHGPSNEVVIEALVENYKTAFSIQ